VPLFERLIDSEPAVSSEPHPFRVFERDDLEESIRRSISRILNSRSAVPGHLQEYTRGTVLDYGIPDISTFSPASESDRVALGDIIARSIAMFEPRLTDILVTIEPHPENHRAMIGTLRAVLATDSVQKAVSFPLSINREGADAVADEPTPVPKADAQAASK
jgi:type VI secretion system protein ImpF